MVEMYGPERLLVNSAGDWGPSKPTAVPDFIVAMRRRGHPESLIKRIVYDNPVEFFRQSRNFKLPGEKVSRHSARRLCRHGSGVGDQTQRRPPAR